MTEQSMPVVVVTGGLSGIGASVVQDLRANGWRVVVIDLSSPDRDAEGCRVVDVTIEEAVDRAAEEIEDSFGPVSGLVNAAGILGKMHPPDRLRMSDWDREIAVDLRGTFLTCRAFGSKMASRRQGAIVNVASIVGLSSAPVHGYAPAKAAVIALTRTLAAEWGPSGVRVNAVSPGFTRTPALEAGIAAGALSEERLTRQSALGRLVEASEVAHCIRWLMGPESSAVTGVNIPVDAGFLVGATWEAYGGLRER